MKKVIFGLILTLISVTGLNNTIFAAQYIYEYRDLGNDTTLKMTYEEVETDVILVNVEIIHEDN